MTARGMHTGKPNRKRVLILPKYRKENINMDLIYTGWLGMDWINLAQEMDKWQAVVQKVMNFWIL